jgi:hypothetical protein
MVTFIKKLRFLKMIRQGTAGALLLCAAFSAPAHAQMPGTGVSYYLSQDVRNPTYQIALQQMLGMYKKDPWHWNGSEWLHYPVIGLGDTFLNADKFPEIIAYPTEDADMPEKFCVENGKCPHLVLEVRDKGVHRLGLIGAYTITRDDKIENGYSNLRVYTKSPDVDAYYYEIYKYDPKKDAYAPAPK